jgi:hypothetical protein
MNGVPIVDQFQVTTLEEANECLERLLPMHSSPLEYSLPDELADLYSPRTLKS